MEFKKAKLRVAESRMVVARGDVRGKWEGIGHGYKVSVVRNV